jgi:hypothetical protein
VKLGFKNGFFVSKVENGVWDTICQEGRVVGTVTLTDMKELVFGRAPTCDVVLDHASISRQVHFSDVYIFVIQSSTCHLLKFSNSAYQIYICLGF